jgi:hypothetical protein
MALVNVASSSASSAAVRGRITLPRIGPWYADLVLADDVAADLVGRVSVTIGPNDQVLKGTAYRVGADPIGKTHLRVVAGAGALAKPCAPKAYANVPARIPLSDVVTGCGEQLSTTCNAAALAAQLPAWSTLAQPSGEVVAELVAAAGSNLAWRMLLDGTLWLGPETWPAAGIDYSLVDSEPEYGRVKIATDEPTLLPGTALDLGNVSYVEHHITPDRVRTLAWLEPATAVFDRVKAPWVKFVQAAMRKVDRYALYRARVVSQSGDLTRFDVQPDSPLLPTFKDVRLRHGMPGLKVQVSPGAYVLIGFEDGDPRRPYVAEWGRRRVRAVAAARGQHAGRGAWVTPSTWAGLRPWERRL